MKHDKYTQEAGMGILPAKAPLANPYVPFQPTSPPKYEAQKGLIRGTLFPGLDLPFKGMVNQKELPVTRKSQMQVLAFAVNELALYLDTHPDDGEALELYRQYQRLYRKMTEEFVKNCGPVTHASLVESDDYSWLDDPWPWEYAANKEG